VRRHKLRYIDGKRSEAELIRVQQIRPELSGDMEQHARTLSKDKLILLHPFQRNIRSSELKGMPVSQALCRTPGLLLVCGLISHAYQGDCVSSLQQLRSQLFCKRPNAAKCVSRQQDPHATSLSPKSEDIKLSSYIPVQRSLWANVFLVHFEPNAGVP
jgi:hypothetical protein